MSCAVRAPKCCGLDKIEGALVPKADIAGIERRVTRIEGQLTWGVLPVVAGTVVAALHWHR